MWSPEKATQHYISYGGERSQDLPWIAEGLVYVYSMTADNPWKPQKEEGSTSTNRFYSTDLSNCFQERHGVGQETQESHLRSRSCCEKVWGSSYAPFPVPLTEQAWGSWGRAGASVTLWTQLRIPHHRSGKEKPSSLWVTAGQYSGYRSRENPATSGRSGLWEGPTSRPRYMVLPTATAQPEQKGIS